MASVLLSPVGNGQQFFDNNGIPLAGGKIYTYQAGSSTNLSTYTTNVGTIANTNPIILDASGRTPNEIWLLEGFSYKFIVKDANDVQITSLDNLYPILQNAPASAPSVPSGVITMWSGSIGSVPSGWYLCDGSNGTPDLRDRFIIAAGSTYSPGDTGGSTAYTPNGSVAGTVGGTALTVAQIPKHRHSIGGAGGGSYYGGDPGDNTSQSWDPAAIVNKTTYSTLYSDGTTPDTHDHSFSASFTGSSTTITPPYYALAFIMKG